MVLFSRLNLRLVEGCLGRWPIFAEFLFEFVRPRLAGGCILACGGNLLGGSIVAALF